MKVFLLILLSLFLADSGEKYLSDIPAYQKESYFKQKVYEEHDWKSFYQMKEANQLVDPNAYDLHLLNAAIFFSTNKLREVKKLKPLKFSAGLRDAAVIHSYQMVTKNFFNHVNNKTPKLRAPDDRIKMFVPNFKALGENIDWNNMEMPSRATYLELADKLVDVWYHSPPHKKTMLSKDYSHLGCAAFFEAKDKGPVRYVKATQDFSLE
jgi:uncharacterized protein YkwD